MKGVPNSAARELKSRKKVYGKAAGIRVRAESKKDMKKRTGFSPDEADAILGMCMLARDRLGFLPGDPALIVNGQIIEPRLLPEKAMDEVYETCDYSNENLTEYLDYVEI